VRIERRQIGVANWRQTITSQYQRHKLSLELREA
jgi:hypothetical protein